jgi:hypothetical protein
MPLDAMRVHNSRLGSSLGKSRFSGDRTRPLPLFPHFAGVYRLLFTSPQYSEENASSQAMHALPGL